MIKKEQKRNIMINQETYLGAIDLSLFEFGQAKIQIGLQQEIPEWFYTENDFLLNQN